MENHNNISSKYNSTSRFDKRAESYSKYRPDYPEELITFLEIELHLTKDMTMAEIGSGTGMFARHFLKKSYGMICVEPNKGMRDYSSQLLSTYEKAAIINGSAEDTKLASESIDRIFVAQSFHWFDFEKTKKEFKRVLKKNGAIAICWILHNNETDFEKGFELLREKFSISPYPIIRNDEKTLEAFFYPSTMKKAVLRFKSQLTYESLKGLLLSTSFLPQEGDAEYNNMLKSLSMLFDKYHIDEYVVLNYHIPIYWGSK